MMDRRLFMQGALVGGASIVLPSLAHAGSVIKLRDLYNKDLSFSDYAKDRVGARVQVLGYMAPPLKADARFFVLTKRPMSVCPFCETEAEWPDDILAIYTKRALNVLPFNVPLHVSGRLALGTHTDPETGFVSRVRLMDASYDRA